jgi:hypothetical protein
MSIGIESTLLKVKSYSQCTQEPNTTSCHPNDLAKLFVMLFTISPRVSSLVYLIKEKLAGNTAYGLGGNLHLGSKFYSLVMCNVHYNVRMT